MELEQLKLPIGVWVAKKKYTDKEIQRNITLIEKLPNLYKRLTKNLSEEELTKAYREGAWNIRQLLTHVSDMHILHYARFKQALCDENPVGFVANIGGWNSLQEVNTAPIATSLLLLEATHKRWAHLLKTMEMSDFERTFHHPLRGIDLTLAQALSMGVWHSKHHLEHIKIALKNS